jgi:hypothetical protein
MTVEIMKYKIKNIKRIIIVPMLLFFLIVSPFSAYANSLTSTNYQVDGFNTSLGGDSNSASTNYQLQSSIELVIDAIKTADVPPPPDDTGGGGTPPDFTAPVITNVTSTNISDSSATIKITCGETAFPLEDSSKDNSNIDQNGEAKSKEPSAIGENEATTPTTQENISFTQKIVLWFKNIFSRN